METMTIRYNFEEQLSDLQEELLRLGRFVQEAHGRAIDAVMRGDLALAEKTVDDDDVADDMAFSIQTRATQILALQQPMARDLRFVASSLKIAVDLERIGDHASEIAKVTRVLGAPNSLRPPANLNQLSILARKMVDDALQAFVKHDSQLAIQIARDDDAVDDLCDEVEEAMLDQMRTDPARVEVATRLLLAARALERVADHATNVAEQVYYVETGQWRALGREEHNYRLLQTLGVEDTPWKAQGEQEDASG